MSEQREAPSATRKPVKPPWWLITSWGRWAFWTALYPLLMSIGPLQRIHEGRRTTTLDAFMLTVLGFFLLVGLVQLVLTLRAYRRDPGLRTREWPSPPPGPGLSRRVWVAIALTAVAAVSLVLLLSAGWPAAVFVAGISVGLVVLYVRFDLFADDRPEARQVADRPGSDSRGPAVDR